MMRTRASLLSLVLLAAGNARSADELPAVLAKSETAGGLHTISFISPTGVIRVYLPDDLRPGDTISGTISQAPQGPTPETRATNQAMLGRHAVELGQQNSPVNSPTVRWTLPDAPPAGGLVLVLKNDQGVEMARALVPVMARMERAAQAYHLPEVGQTGRSIEIIGPFDGDFSTTLLKLDDAALALVAESPRKLIARNSNSKQGMTLLDLREGDRTAGMDFRSVGVNLAAPKTALLKGEKTTLTVKVAGLEGLAKPFSLLLENSSTEVISLSGGNTERFRIKPAEVAAGSMTIERAVTGIKSGSWTITCSVVKDE